MLVGSLGAEAWVLRGDIAGLCHVYSDFRLMDKDAIALSIDQRTPLNLALQPGDYANDHHLTSEEGRLIV